MQYCQAFKEQLISTKLSVEQLTEEHIGKQVLQLDAAKLVAWPNYRLVTAEQSYDSQLDRTWSTPDFGPLVIKKINHRKDGHTTILFQSAANNYVCEKNSTIILKQ